MEDKLIQKSVISAKVDIQKIKLELEDIFWGKPCPLGALRVCTKCRGHPLLSFQDTLVFAGANVTW